MSPPPLTDPAAEPPAAVTGAPLRRRRVLWLLGGGAAAVTAAGLGMTRFIRSPAQRLADVSAPPKSTLTAVVERRVLVDTVVLRGTVGAGTTVTVTPAPQEAERAIVTAARVVPGERFEAGKALLEVSGRPVFALAGEIPAFRDLRPGMRGPDVQQLQAALTQLGYPAGDPDGEFGARTKTALASLYNQLGYQVPTSGDPGSLAAADSAVRQAERALVAAEATLERLRADPPPADPGADPVADAELQVRFAREDLDAARAARSEVERTTGPMLPFAEVIFLPDFPARVEQSAARVGVDVSQLDGPLLTVSSGELAVRGQVSPGQRGLLEEGMPVEVLEELGGVLADGEIASIGELGTDQLTGVRGHSVTVVPTAGAFDERLAGAEVRLTVAAAATDGEVLVVPLSAVFTGADGRVAVLRLGPDERQQRVEVAPGVSGDGHVAVTPVDGELVTGDRVVVGDGGGQ